MTHAPRMRNAARTDADGLARQLCPLCIQDNVLVLGVVFQAVLQHAVTIALVLLMRNAVLLDVDGLARGVAFLFLALPRCVLLINNRCNTPTAAPHAPNAFKAAARVANLVPWPREDLECVRRTVRRVR